ncbi:MAG: NADH-quinone oxidoreductase subunit A [Armatimonadota bacterium]
MTNQSISIAIFVGLGIVFWMVVLGFSLLVRPKRAGDVKETSYECGINPVGRAWYQVHVRYYIYALLFVLFDVEVAFLYPWAVIFRNVTSGQLFLFAEVIIFLFILIFGLVYAWRKGALEWE